MTLPFNKVFTIYHKTKTEEGIVWHKQILDGVYYTLTKMLINDSSGHSYVNAHLVVIPYEIDIEVGDVARIGSCDIELSTNDSAREVLRNGGWEIKSCDKNTYPNHPLSHIAISDV